MRPSRRRSPAPAAACRRTAAGPTGCRCRPPPRRGIPPLGEQRRPCPRPSPAAPGAAAASRRSDDVDVPESEAGRTAGQRLLAARWRRRRGRRPLVGPDGGDASATAASGFDARGPAVGRSKASTSRSDVARDRVISRAPSGRSWGTATAASRTGPREEEQQAGAGTVGGARRRRASMRHPPGGPCPGRTPPSMPWRVVPG